MSRDTSLVDTEWAEAHLDDPTVVLIEVDEDTTAYDKGHIRGAIKLDWRADLQDGSGTTSSARSAWRRC
jgi:thiosulfate/3-mercaptopyruvate sulfurtransferase